MNLDEIIFKLVENNMHNTLEEKIDNIISTIDIHVNMYNKAVDEDDMHIAAIVLNKCINYSISIIIDYCKNIDINKLKKLSDNLIKAKNIVNIVLDDRLKNINIIIDNAAIKEMTKCSKCKNNIDYSKYTKEELIEMLRNK